MKKIMDGKTHTLPCVVESSVFYHGFPSMQHELLLPLRLLQLSWPSWVPKEHQFIPPQPSFPLFENLTFKLSIRGYSVI